MNSARKTGIDLLKRLLGGERGQVPLNLAMLLERSSPLNSGDDHYRQILPPELVDVQLSADTAAEITAALITEISRNPDAALISTISFAGSDLATRAIADLVTTPPRPLTISESDAALSLLNQYLPHRLAQDPNFLPRAVLVRLVQVAGEFEDIEETGADRSARIGAKHHASQLLEKLSQLGVGG